MGRHVTLNDSLVSMLTSLGQKSAARGYSDRRALSDKQLWAMYQNSWIAQKFVNKTSEDMVKRWREVESSDFTPEEQAEFAKLEFKFKLKDIAEELLIWTSLFGEAIVLAITDIENEAYETELNIDAEELRRFIVIDKGLYKSTDVIDDILSEHFGQPEYYTINNGLKVHHSRVYHAFAGMKPLSKSRTQKVGVSDLQGSNDVIRMFDTISTSISDLSEESKVDIQKITGLNAQIASGQEDKVLQYAHVAKMSKSQSGTILIDADSEYDQKEVSFAGLSDIWVKAGNVLAGAMDRPVTVLFGQSASGFNSGEEDNKNYYDTILALQESRLRPLLDFCDKFIFDVMGKEPAEWEYVFPSLDTMNKSDEATIFGTWATGIVALLQEGLITEEMALKELKQRGLFINITDEDIAAIKEAGDYYEPTNDGGKAEATDTFKARW